MIALYDLSPQRSIAYTTQHDMNMYFRWSANLSFHHARIERWLSIGATCGETSFCLQFQYRQAFNRGMRLYELEFEVLPEALLYFSLNLFSSNASITMRIESSRSVQSHRAVLTALVASLSRFVSFWISLITFCTRLIIICQVRDEWHRKAAIYTWFICCTSSWFPLWLISSDIEA